MHEFGIEALNCYIPKYYLELSNLARGRGINPRKLSIGLGQNKMALPTSDEDIVTMAAAAAEPLCTVENLDSIDTLLFATETGVDQSKSAGIFVHKLLNLSKSCRVVELKQACYSATSALQFAIGLLYQNPKRKILIIASDIARYKLDTSAESSQGAGAVAMLISNDPKLATIEEPSVFLCEEHMDFWRPNYMTEPMVDGRYSCDIYIKMLRKVWKEYLIKSQRKFSQHDYFCYHTPVPRLVEKAHASLVSCLNLSVGVDTAVINKQINSGLVYGREIGNTYSASLYFNLISTLLNIDCKKGGQRLALYSYGSGSMAELFCLRLNSDYHKYIDHNMVECQLVGREEVDFSTYLNLHKNYYNPNQYCLTSSNKYRLRSISEHQRIYCINDEKNMSSASSG